MALPILLNEEEFLFHCRTSAGVGAKCQRRIGITFLGIFGTSLAVAIKKEILLKFARDAGDKPILVHKNACLRLQNISFRTDNI